MPSGVGYAAAPKLRIGAAERHDQQLFDTTSSGGGQREEGKARLSQVIASQLDNCSNDESVGEMFFIDISTVRLKRSHLAKVQKCLQLHGSSS